MSHDRRSIRLILVCQAFLVEEFCQFLNGAFFITQLNVRLGLPHACFIDAVRTGVTIQNEIKGIYGWDKSLTVITRLSQKHVGLVNLRIVFLSIEVYRVTLNGLGGFVLGAVEIWIAFFAWLDNGFFNFKSLYGQNVPKIIAIGGGQLFIAIDQRLTPVVQGVKFRSDCVKITRHEGVFLS